MSFDQLMQKAAEIERKAVEVELAHSKTRAFPDGPRRPVNPVEVEAKYQGAAVPLFEPFSRMPDPRAYEGMLADLTETVGDLSHGYLNDPIDKQPVPANPKLDRINAAAEELGDWTGEAAAKFKRKFLHPLDSISTNQFILLATMKGALEAHQAMWLNAREDIEKIADETIHSLDNVGGGCGKNEVNFVFSVAAAVGAIAAIPLTGGVSAAGAVLSAVGAVGASGVASADSLKGGGGSAEQVVRSMQTAIDTLTTKIGDTEEKIAKVLDDNASALAQTKPIFVSPRPAFVGMEGKELTSEEGLGRLE